MKVRTGVATLLVVLALFASMQPFGGVQASHVTGSGGGTAGSFEIDGNLADNQAGEPVDWSNQDLIRTPFTDPSKGVDDIFTLGSKNEEPGEWACAEDSSAPAKDDILSGDIAFREVDNAQWAYVDFFRLSKNGSANVDFEFNQSKVPNPSCPALPTRTAGDIVIAFDADQGGKNIDVRAFTWTGDALVGTFVPSGNLVEHTDWDGAVNIPNTIPGSPAPAPGTYGEASLNLTEAFGAITCGEFSSAHIKSRASREINSALKDRTLAKPVDVGKCPDSNLDKGVRNLSTSSSGAFQDTVTADPGDTIEYQLVYTNTGEATATNVVISDPIPDYSSLFSCSDACIKTGDPVVTSVSWNLGSVAAGADPITRTFQVTLDATFSTNSATSTNVASVDTTEEDPTPSDTTTVTIAAPPASALAKGVRNVTTGDPDPAGTFAISVDASPGDTIEYRFTYTNEGSGPATGVTIGDEVRDHSTFVSCTDECTTSGTAPGSTITWDIGTVAAGGNATVSLRTVLDATFTANSTTIVNVGSTDSDQEPPEDSNSTEVRVTADPASALAKGVRNVTSGDPDPADTFATSVSASPGDTIEYQFTYTNEGSGPATGVVIGDEVPDHSTFVSCSQTPACTRTPPNGTAPGTVVTWSIGTVAAGGSATVSFRTVLDATFAKNSTTITNVGTVTDQRRNTDSNSTEVIVTASPAAELVKSATNLTATDGNHPGDTIEYSFAYTNTGSGPANGVVVSDEVPQRTSFVSCSQAPPCSRTPEDGTAPGTLVSWSLGEVPAGGTHTVSFQVRLDATFPSGPTLVCNVGTVTDQTGSTISNEVCITVEANPDLKLLKSANGATFGSGDEITYTLAYANEGDGDATGVVVSDPVPDNTTYKSCTDDCTTDGPPVTTVTWAIGDVPAGTGGSVTFTVTVTATVGCEICNTATITSPDQPASLDTPVESNQLCVEGLPGPRPDLANASGSAFAASVSDTILGLDETLVPAGSTQSGVGSDHQDDQLATALPAPGDAVLSAELLSTSSTSTVTDSPAKASSDNFAEVANVNIAGGLVTADLVRAVAGATATGTSASVSSTGSTFKNLVVNGEAINDVTPGQTIDLSAVFGAGSFVKLLEQTSSTSAPPNQSGDFEADITVNMIRVHLADKVPDLVLAGDQTLDVTVSSATAHSDFPQITRCLPQATQSVSGHAFMLSETTDPALLPNVQGLAGPLAPTGGDFHLGHDEAAVPENGSVLTSGTWVTDTTGSIDDAAVSTASSYAQGEGVCVLGCTVSAQLVRSQANSTAAAGAAASNDLETFLVNVNVLGDPIASPPDNKVIELPGIGFVVLNEQVPDAASAGHTGLTVRAIRVVITKGENPFNLPVGAVIIVAEAHSDATFIAP